MSNLKIGQVANLAGVAVDTVRYYERVGLLAKAPRRSSGYRAFDVATVERLKLIKQIQDLGLSLEEIHGMLEAITEQNSDCTREATRLEAVLYRTEQKIAALKAVRKKLKEALTRCGRGDCDLVEKVRRTAREGTRNADGSSQNNRATIFGKRR